MKKSDRYTAVFWGLFGFYIAFEGYRLKLGTLRNPRAGFFVFWSGILLLCLSLFLVIKSLVHFKLDVVAERKDLKWFKGIILMAGLFVYTMVFQWLGFLLSTFFLLIFLFKALHPQRWRVALILAMVTTAFCQLIFGVFLDLRFPEGVLKNMVKWF